MSLARTNPGTKTQMGRFLAQAPLLAGLEPEQATALAEDFERVTYKRGEIIFRQGDMSRDIYFIYEGKVRIVKISPTGGETLLNIFGRGDVFGEFAALDGLPRSATATAIGRIDLLRLTADGLGKRIRDMPELGLAIARLIIDKARWTAAYAESMAQYDAAGRLLQLLLLYQKQFGQPLEPGGQYLLDLSLNQNDLASMVGTRREWVNHLLRRWREERLLEYQAGKILILDLARVEAERDQCIRGSKATSH